MIEGVVNAHYEAVVRLSLRNSSGQTRDVDTVVDTSFNGFLTLPPTLIAELGLTRLGQKNLVLANGRRDVFDTYGVTVFWEGQSKFIDADEADAVPLLGMSMLDNHDLSIQVRDGAASSSRPQSSRAPTTPPLLPLHLDSRSGPGTSNFGKPG